MSKITRMTKIGDLLRDHPEAAKVLQKFNLNCPGCGGIEHETIFLGATAHGLDPDAIVDALNRALK